MVLPMPAAEVFMQDRWPGRCASRLTCIAVAGGKHSVCIRQQPEFWGLVQCLQHLPEICMLRSTVALQASRPGLELWMQVVDVLLERQEWTDAEAWHNNPIYQTGPLVLSAAMERHLQPAFTHDRVHIPACQLIRHEHCAVMHKACVAC